MHVFPAFDPTCVETMLCLAEVAAFLDSVWSGNEQAEEYVQRGGEGRASPGEVDAQGENSDLPSNKTRFLPQLSASLVLLGLMPGLVIGFFNIKLGATLLVFSMLGYAWSTRTLRILRRKVHLRIQHSVHKDLNEMYKELYDGQAMDHPYTDTKQMMHYSQM